MEILSIGEKIKRARIYKGYTLNDLCDGRISVSTMSCIENNKVSLQPQLLKLIAEKLEMDADYLNENIEEQIIKNIEICNNIFEGLSYENEMLYNLEVSELYGYFDYAFSIIHSLFLYYVKFKFNEKIHNILARYHEICFKVYSEENYRIYSMDIGKFLFLNKEYEQAINYYKVAKANMVLSDISKTNIIDAFLEEIRCNIILKNYKDAYDVAELLLEHAKNIKDNNRLSQLYHLGAITYLRNGIDDYMKLENKAIKINKENYYISAENKFDYAFIFFESGFKIKAIEFLEKGIEIYPKQDKVNLTRFILKNINLLIKNYEIKMADNLCEDCLNLAINLANDKLIERAYYYKSLILYGQCKFSSAETYINLSLDVLTKFGKKHDIYVRYMEIGNMYSKIGLVSDSLKYFSLAISLMKNI